MEQDPDSTVVDVHVEQPPEGHEAPASDASAGAGATADLINHDRIQAVESSLTELREALDSKVSQDDLPALLAHDHPEYVSHGELDERLAEGVGEPVIIQAPEPEPVPELDEDDEGDVLMDFEPKKIKLSW